MKSNYQNFCETFFGIPFKFFIGLSLLALLLAGCADKVAAPAQAIATLPVIAINEVSATTETEFPASIEGTTDIEIRPQVTGTLEKIFVDEGAFVTQGQPLFKINDNMYREQRNNALAGLNAAKASATNAQLEIEKLTPLVQNKVVSDYQLKTAKASLSIANANVEQARALAATAQINLGYTVIKAPVSGYIGRLLRKQGSQLSPADPEALTKLSDNKKVYAYFSLGESDFINFKSQYAGKTMTDKFKSLPPVSLLLADGSTYPEGGKVDMVDGQFDQNTGSITLRATFSNAKGLLRSGNTGRVKFSMVHNNSLLVPQESTIEIQDKVFVFLVDNKNAVTRQPIAISGKSGNNYLISDGVKSGDRIVAKGFENLTDGTTIKVEEPKKTLAKI